MKVFDVFSTFPAVGTLPFPLEHFDVKAFTKFAADPQDTASVFDIQKGLLASPRRAEMVAHIQQILATDENFIQLYNERYIPKFPTTAELAEYPEGTYGKAVANHLIQNKIELDFAGLDIGVFVNQEMSLLGYLNIRGIRTHDLFHVLLGLGTTPIDEYAVASFTLAQFASPYHMLLVASGYVNTAFQAPEMIPTFMAQTHKMYELGKKAIPLVGFKLEEHFGTPLEELRKILRLQ